MSIIELLTDTLGHKPSELQLASFFADRISAIEQQKRIANEDGDNELLIETSHTIKSLRTEARSLGIDDGKYPGIYR